MSKALPRIPVAQRFPLRGEARRKLPPDHPALFVSDLIDQFDLAPLFVIPHAEASGASLHPALMAKLLVYGYFCGIESSRGIYVATYVDPAFRALCGDIHPDPQVIAGFRRRHMADLESLFYKIVAISRRGGIGTLGEITVHGVKHYHRRVRHGSRSWTEDRRDARKALRRLTGRIGRSLRAALLGDDDDLGAAGPDGSR